MNTQTLHTELIAWYDSCKRELPWRDTDDPYRIWISEIILQQTRVAQGLAYYLRFVDTFPTVAQLAQADEKEVLLLWQGLGYYSRARNLHAAARQVMQEYGGVFPRDYTAVRSLKGVGDYTAAAICAFAYDQPYAVVDGNVYRVLSRLQDDETPIDTTFGKKHFQQLADECLDREQPRLYNQAIMELGALCCTPVSPQCGQCPIEKLCLSYAHGTSQLLPLKQNKGKQTDRYFTYLIYISGSATLLQQRTKRDIWQHLYEFPLVESDRLLEPKGAEELNQVHGKVVKTLQLKHLLSHQRINARFLVIDTDRLPLLEGVQKVNLNELSEYPLSRLTLRAIEQLTDLSI